MAGTLATLVLRGNRVSDVVTDMVRSGANLAVRQTPGLLSHPRRLSQPTWQADYPPATPLGLIDAVDEDRGGQRAGRLGSSVGVLVRRSPAMGAGRTVLWGWSFTAGGPTASAAGCAGLFTASTPASGAKALPERQSSGFTGGVRSGDRRMPKPGNRAMNRPANATPAGRTFLTSTRGKRGG